MPATKTATLFVGNDSESDRAIKAVNQSGIEYRSFNTSSGKFEFDTPLLITAWGVFDGLSSIIWFAKISEEQKLLV